jgi:hypothetical protein
MLARPKLEVAFEGKSPEKQIFGVNFLGFIRGVPFLVGRGAVVTSSVGKPITVGFEPHGCPGDVCNKNGEATYFVPKETIAPFERDNPNYLRGNPPGIVRVRVFSSSCTRFLTQTAAHSFHSFQNGRPKDFLEGLFLMACNI